MLTPPPTIKKEVPSSLRNQAWYKKLEETNAFRIVSTTGGIINLLTLKTIDSGLEKQASKAVEAWPDLFVIGNFMVPGSDVVVHGAALATRSDILRCLVVLRENANVATPAEVNFINVIKDNIKKRPGDASAFLMEVPISLSLALVLQAIKKHLKSDASLVKVRLYSNGRKLIVYDSIISSMFEEVHQDSDDEAEEDDDIDE